MVTEKQHESNSASIWSFLIHHYKLQDLRKYTPCPTSHACFTVLITSGAYLLSNLVADWQFP